MAGAQGCGPRSDTLRPDDQREICQRVVARALGGAEAGGDEAALRALAETLHHERQRIAAGPGGAARRHALARLEAIGASVVQGREQALEQLRAYAWHFVHEVVGNFNPTVYRLATRVVPGALALLLNALSPRVLWRSFPHLPQLEDHVRVMGATESLKALHRLGTVVLVPTHVSNMDSPVLGWLIYRLGLPPFTYGAGLNLFSNALISFFMHNLGAYKVDRQKTAPLYKDILKHYCAASLELGYSNLFFPGGTRCRSGEVEDRLKLGLLGAGLGAYIDNLQAGKQEPRIFIVPCTMNYQIVLEAASLIREHLTRSGRGRYILEGDEFSRPRRILNFLSALVRLDARVYLRVGQALDPFGHAVDDDGTSRDARGRAVDIRRYVLADGRPAHDEHRDRAYTRMLGERVAETFRHETVYFSTHVAAFAVFQRLRALRPQGDLYHFLRGIDDAPSLTREELRPWIQRLLARLRERERWNLGHLDPRLHAAAPDELLDEAIRHFGCYHTWPVLEAQGERVRVGDANLLYYYRNRLAGYGLEEAL